VGCESRGIENSGRDEIISNACEYNNMREFSVEHKERMSESAKKRCTPTWRKMMSDKHSTELPLEEVIGMYKQRLTQEQIGKVFGVSQKVVWGFMKRYGIKARIPIKKNQWGEDNHNWKGDAASYTAFHSRLERKLGKPTYCEQCKTSDKRKNYDWCNLTGKFEDESDYKRMCRSCHRKYDNERRCQ